jgi:predicted dienelactone hydrolase
MRILAVLFFLLVAALPCGARADEPYQPGFRTLGSWSTAEGLRLDVNVWYPSTRQARDLSYPPWEFSAARGGKPAEGRFPLLLLSHGTAGTRFSYHDTASWLASRGFVVAAPTHARDNMDNMDDLFSWRQLDARVRELYGVIDLLLADPETAPSVDAERIGVLGFGSAARRPCCWAAPCRIAPAGTATAAWPDMPTCTATSGPASAWTSSAAACP